MGIKRTKADKEWIRSTHDTHIEGDRRNTLIKKFQDWKGQNYVPENVHPAIQWSSKSPFEPLEDDEDIKYEFNKSNNSDPNPQPTKKIKVAKEKEIKSMNAEKFVNSKKHKLDEVNTNMNHDQPYKKIKFASPLSDKTDDDINSPNQITTGPIGFKWDSQNYSCSYDALFTILYNIWSETPIHFRARLAKRNTFTAQLEEQFQYIKNHIISPEAARDNIRPLIHDYNPSDFPLGRKGASMIHLSDLFFKSDRRVADKNLKCTNCLSQKSDIIKSYLFKQIQQFEGTTTQKWFKFITSENPAAEICENCNQNLMTYTNFHKVPAVIALDIYAQKTSISHKLTFKIWDDVKALNLAGIVYLGDEHFTARIIEQNKNMWWHDGITTKSNCIFEGNLKNITPQKLKYLHGKKACLAIYSSCTK